MDDRLRVYHCAIAGKPVRAALRQGGALGEPARIYVRCDQRDCQHVDLNQPPCTLTTAMFDDGSSRGVAIHLQAAGGSPVCYACLTAALGLRHEQVRRAGWRLKDHPGVSIGPARCVACRQRGVTIRIARGVELAGASFKEAPTEPAPTAAVSTQPDALAAYLRRQPGFQFCARCLARELRTRPGPVREAMTALEAEPHFSARSAQCASCRLIRPGIRFDGHPAQDDGSRAVIEFLAQRPGERFCMACIALSVGLGLAHSRRIVQHFRAVPELEHAEAACSACGRLQATVGVREDRDAAAGGRRRS
jgi:hypothetical protein